MMSNIYRNEVCHAKVKVNKFDYIENRPMSNSVATLRQAALDGIAKNCEKHHVTLEQAAFIIPDILEALFKPEVVWAIKEYLKESEV